MASNPLQIGVVGGNVNIPTAEVSANPSMVQGAPVQVNRTISSIMDAVSSVTKLGIGVAEVDKQMQDRITQQEDKFARDAERSAYHNEKQKAQVNQTTIDVWNSKINLAMAEADKTGGLYYHSDKSKELVSGIEDFLATPEIDPLVKSRVSASYAGLMGDQRRFSDSAAATDKAEAHRRQTEAQARMRNAKSDFVQGLVSKMKLDISTGTDPEKAYKDALIFGNTMFGMNPQDSDFSTPLLVAKNESLIVQNHNAKIEADKQAAAEFYQNSGTLNEDAHYLTLADKHLETPEGFSAAVTANHAAMEAYASSLSADFYGINQFDSRHDTMVRDAHIENPTPAQANYMVQFERNYQRVRSELVNRTAKQVMISSSEKVYAQFGNEHITPDNTGEAIAGAINQVSGVPEGVVVYKDGEFTMADGVTDPTVREELSPMLAKARDMKQELDNKFIHTLPLRNATAKLTGNQTLLKADLDALGDHLSSLSPQQVEKISTLMPMGGDLNDKFKNYVTEVISNPRDGSGNARWDDIAKTMMIVDNSGLINSIFEGSAVGINDIAKRRLVAAKAFFEYKKNQTGSKVNLIGVLNGLRGGNNDAMAVQKDFMDMLDSVGNPAGSAVEKSIKYKPESVDNALTVAYGSSYNIAVSDSMKDYMSGWYKQFKIENPNADDAHAGEFLHQSLKAVGYSLVPTGNILRPVRDPNGILPNVKDLQSAVDATVDFVPKAGSDLHVSYLTRNLGHEPTPEMVKATSGMPIWKMDMYLRTGSSNYSRPNFTVDYSGQVVDQTANDWAHPKVTVTDGVASGISDNNMLSVWNSGLRIKNSTSNEEVFGVYVNNRTDMLKNSEEIRTIQNESSWMTRVSNLGTRYKNYVQSLPGRADVGF